MTTAAINEEVVVLNFPPVQAVTGSVAVTGVTLSGSFNPTPAPSHTTTNFAASLSSQQATVCMYGSNENPLTVCPTDPVLPRDGLHQRGTFPNADKIYNSAAGSPIDTANGIQVFELNSSAAGDEDAVGVDGTDGSSQTLKGNIGVVYRVHLNAVASDGQNLGFLLNPRGGYWGTAVNVMPGLLPGGIFLVPASSEGFSNNTMAGVQGDYSPGASGDSPWMQWMMTGGSNAPVMFVAVPH